MTETSDMTTRETGKSGDEVVRTRKHDSEFYSTIGRLGGNAVKASRGSDYYSLIGKRGGDSMKASHGTDFYSLIGKRGGNAVKASHGPEYYSLIGKMAGRPGGPARTDGAT
jgi:uncharacterized protein